MPHTTARHHVRRLLVALVALTTVAALVGCSDDGGDDGGGTTTTTTTAATSTSTEAPATSATTDSSTSSSEPAEPITLRFDGVGPATIGQPADDAVAALTGALGAPTSLQPWTQPACEVAGPGSEGARAAVWDGLVVSFRGATEAGATLAGWTYRGGPVGSAGELVLDSGVGVGDAGDALATAYGTDATFVPAEVFDPHWEVTQGGASLWAVVEADDPSAAIARMDLDPIVCE